MGKILFVTGTDTGVGKTLLTALLLVHLRAQGCHALACKPFCTGGRRDVRILHQAQDGELTPDQINPFHFSLAVAPLVAARAAGQTVALDDVEDRIRTLSAGCDVLLVEGAGGLFVPLGDDYSVATVIAALQCPVTLVARNRLGEVNHVLLSLTALRALPIPEVKIALVDQARPDLASRTNPALLAERCAPTKVLQIPFLGQNASEMRRLKETAKMLKKTLAGIFGTDTFSIASGG